MHMQTDFERCWSGVSDDWTTNIGGQHGVSSHGTMAPIIEPPMLVVGMVSPIAKPSTSIIFTSKKKM